MSKEKKKTKKEPEVKTGEVVTSSKAEVKKGDPKVLILVFVFILVALCGLCAFCGSLPFLFA